MTPNRKWLIPLIVGIVAAAALGPLAIRGVLRYHALYKVLKRPEARERLSIQPTWHEFAALKPVHPINLGYATFDTGATNPISIAATASGAVLLTNRDVSIAFLLPFAPDISSDPSIEQTVGREERAHPHIAAYLREAATDPMAAEMAVEQIRKLSFSQVLLMNNDDFLVYSFRLLLKVGDRLGSKEVWFFTGPHTKGIVRIGQTPNDVRFANVWFVSPDGKTGIGLLLSIPEGSSNTVYTPLEPILRSFRFTINKVGDRDEIKTLIREAGIHQRIPPKTVGE